ncbi:DUF433 domain-containing protein [Kocuria marina]|uniref:DUF433 domain-containing protein n=1 Tax=Kocuria marina TaxID=223184 RepID=UPI0022DFDF13|nr:DUF433 domain-containing protein [Kocuria marina]
MAFPVDLTSVLTGVTPSQLASWRRSGLLVPEVSSRPVRYSFRDLAALRTLSRLRSDIPLQRIRKAFEGLSSLDLTDHPSKYVLASLDNTVVLVEENGEMWDLVRWRGHGVLATLEDVFETFENFRGDTVVDFRRPRAHLEIREKRMGGWPTIADTRIPYDSIAALVAHGADSETVTNLYPAVSAGAIEDAVSFGKQVADRHAGVAA